jgi:hypothetical protein
MGKAITPVAGWRCNEKHEWIEKQTGPWIKGNKEMGASVVQPQ